jgi:hypothetical protein
MNKSDEGKKLIRDAKRSFTVVYFFASVLNLPYTGRPTPISGLIRAWTAARAKAP